MSLRVDPATVAVRLTEDGETIPINVSGELSTNEDGAEIDFDEHGRARLTMWNEGGCNSTSVFLSEVVALVRRREALRHLLDASGGMTPGGGTDG